MNPAILLKLNLIVRIYLLSCSSMNEWRIDNETAVFVSNRNSKFKFGIMSEDAIQKLSKLIRGIRESPTIS
jgi:hypothetical protein